MGAHLLLESLCCRFGSICAVIVNWKGGFRPQASGLKPAASLGKRCGMGPDQRSGFLLSCPLGQQEITPFDATNGREPVENPELVEVVERLFGIFEMAYRKIGVQA